MQGCLPAAALQPHEAPLQAAAAARACRQHKGPVLIQGINRTTWIFAVHGAPKSVLRKLADRGSLSGNMIAVMQRV